MKFTNLKISRECIFSIENVARVKLFIKSVHFQNSRFCSVSKPRKPVFLFRTGPTTTILATKLLHSQISGRISKSATQMGGFIGLFVYILVCYYILFCLSVRIT